MEPQRFERRVYNGAQITGKYRISSIRYALMPNNSSIRTVNVNNIGEYEASCRLHKQCFGHMCKTKGGLVLAPHSMSIKSGDIATEYHKASKFAFEGRGEEYIDAIKKVNYTKFGNMRSVMSTPVAGSCRLIATPQWQFGRGCLAISRNLASRMRVCKKVYDSHGNQEAAYVETELKEDDWVIVVRPPSLNFGNTQPMKVKFWSHDCAGIHPESFSVFHGDFDGDEIQIYPVYNAESIAECESWEQVPLPAFVECRELYNNNINRMSMNGALDVHECDDDDAHFLLYTTLSAKEMMEGTDDLFYGKYTRNKPEHIKGMGQRFNTRSTEDSFVTESIRGMSDVSNQQSTQGHLGGMTRVAKIVASCFHRPAEGGLWVAARSGREPLRMDGVVDSGVPSVRAISSLCAVAQQAALDSHRADTHNTASHDFIGDLVLGCANKESKSVTSKYTMVEFSDKFILTMNTSTWVKWKYARSASVFCLCEPALIPVKYTMSIIGAYNPVVLTMVQDYGNDVVSVCARGIRTICNYYKIKMSELELNDISYVFSYKPGASNHPITSRDGLTSRSLGWIETLQATDYTKLRNLQTDFEAPHTTTAAMFMSNFSLLTEKHD